MLNALLNLRMKIAADLLWIVHLLTWDVCSITVESVGKTVVMSGRRVTVLSHVVKEAA